MEVNYVDSDKIIKAAVKDAKASLEMEGFEISEEEEEALIKNLTSNSKIKLFIFILLLNYMFILLKKGKHSFPFVLTSICLCTLLINISFGCVFITFNICFIFKNTNIRCSFNISITFFFINFIC